MVSLQVLLQDAKTLGIRKRSTPSFPKILLTDVTLRRFGISAYAANPEDLPPSLAQHGSC
jgi:hypothetical protein